MTTQTIRRIAVIGAGTMGHGMAQTFAAAGHPVMLQDLDEGVLNGALAAIRSNLEQLAEKGLGDGGTIDETVERIETTTSLDDATGNADLVIEAVFEDLELKREIFRELDASAPPHAIFASNTSSFMPSALADATGRPDRVIVTHHFFPAHIIPLVEIVGTEATADGVVEEVFALLESVGKKPIIVRKEAVAFIANRLQIAILREALDIVHQGIGTPQDVDTAVKESFGRRSAFVGPFELEEVQAGWDMMLDIVKIIQPHLTTGGDPSPVLLAQVEKGETGPKTGRGFYEWTPDRVSTFNRRLVDHLISLAAIRDDEKPDKER